MNLTDEKIKYLTDIYKDPKKGLAGLMLYIMLSNVRETNLILLKKMLLTFISP